MNRQLKDNPTGCRSLTDPEVKRLRQSHPTLWANPHKTCLTCRHETKDSGAPRSFQARFDGQVVTYDCDCVAQWRLHRWMLNAGIGIRYQRLSWFDADAVNVAAANEVVSYLDNAPGLVNQGRGLTLWAQETGTGKTMLSALLLKGLLAEGYDGFFVQFNEMIDQFTAGWRSEEERGWFIKTIRNAGVLVVDDMGREHKGRAEVVEAMFDTVIRARVAASMPTLITTNYTPQEMLVGYGGNVLSLLSEVNSNVHVPGMDYRPKVALRADADAKAGLSQPFVVA